MFKKDEHQIENCVYPIGMDPKWAVAANRLTFFNSYKMKFAVVIGFVQMGLGIFLKMLNEIHFKRYANLFLEAIPQLIFFVSLFGYMTFCIFFKWTRDDLGDKIAANLPVPSIIQILMDIFLKITSGKVEVPLFGPEDGSLQYSVHLTIVITCLVCVPWMLFPKPILEYRSQVKLKANYARMIEEVLI